MQDDIRARLDASLHNVRYIDLDVASKPGSIKPPWGYYNPEAQASYDDILDAFEACNQRMLLLGHPGSGKTTTLLYIARAMAERALKEEGAPIPVIVNLSQFKIDKRPSTRFSLGRSTATATEPETLSKDRQFEDWFVGEVAKFPGVVRSMARQWLRDRKIAPLLDGLDEFNDDRRADLARLLNETFFDDHADVPMVVCSRINEYKRLESEEATRLALKAAIELKSLSDSQVAHYLKEAGAEGLLESLDEDDNLRQLASKPLTLSMLALAYGDGAEGPRPSRSLSEARHQLFETYVDRMLQRQARRKRGVPSDNVKSNDVELKHYDYKPSRIDTWLGWLALMLSVRMQTNLDPRELTATLLLSGNAKKEVGNFIIPHLAISLAVLIAAGGVIASVGLSSGTGVLWLFAPVVLAMAILPAVSGDNDRSDWLETRKVTLVFVTSIWFFATASVQASDLIGNMIPSIVITAPIMTAVFFLVVLIGSEDELKLLASTALFALLVFSLDLFFLIIQPDALRVDLVIFGTLDLSDPVQNLAAINWFLLAGFLIGLFLVSEGIDEWRETLLTVVAMLLSVYVYGFLVTSVIFLDAGEVTNLVGCVAFISTILVAFASRPTSISGLRKIVITLIACGIAFFAMGLAGGASWVFWFACLMACIGLFLIGARSPIAGGEYLDSDLVSESIFRILDRDFFSPLSWAMISAIGRFPFRYRRFADRMVDAFILKRSGEDIEFVHRLLRDYFAIRSLMPELRSQGDGHVTAITKLSYQGEAALDPLIELANGGSLPSRCAAIEGLTRIPSPAATACIEANTADTDPIIRRAVLNAIASLGSEEEYRILPTVVPLADGSDIHAVIDIYPTRSYSGAWGDYADRLPRNKVEVLLQELKRNDPERIRAVIAFLQDCNDPRIPDALADNLRSNSKQVRLEVARALGEIGDPRGYDELVALTGDRDRAIRFNANRALAHYRTDGPSSVDFPHFRP